MTMLPKTLFFGSKWNEEPNIYCQKIITAHRCKPNQNVLKIKAKLITFFGYVFLGF